MKYFQFISIIVAAICPIVLSAQEGLATEQVEIIKAFDARLANTNKFGLAPQLPALDSTPKIQNYDIQARMLNVQYLPPQIVPSRYRTENPPKVYNGYGKLGGGFPRAFYVDGGYQFSNEQFELGGDIFFNSADNSADIASQKYSTTTVNAEGTYFFEPGYAVSGRLGYNADRLHYYGYNEFNAQEGIERTYTDDEVLQKFNTFSLGASVFNGERTEADFNYRADLDAYFLRDNYASQENGYRLNLVGKKWFEEAHSLELGLVADLTSFTDTASQNLNNYFLRPVFNYHTDAFQARVGVNLTAHEDNFNFFPDVELAVNVLDKVLTAFAGAEGSLYKNNYQNLSNYNPFVATRPELRNTSYFHFYGGVKGEYQDISYSAQVGFKDTENLALFLADGDSIPNLNVVYDSVNIFVISGSVSLPIIENLELIGTITQNVYSTSSQDEAWHLPSLEINAEARYRTMEDKLLLKTLLFVQDGVPFLRADGSSGTLGALFDLNFGAEYQFTDNIGGFIQVNNLLGNNRERWRYYPMLGINGVVGLSARF